MSMGALARGVVFDLDGTLLISHHDFGRMREAIAIVAQKYGVDPEALRSPETVGTSQTVAAAHHALLGVDSTGGTAALFDAECSSRIDDIELEAVARSVEREGASPLLRSLHAAGTRLGLFTRSSQAFCEQTLSKLGWSRLFSSVRTRSSPGPIKPDPEALRILLGDMDLRPGDVAYVGDHPEDARCAAALRIPFYAVLPDPATPASFTTGEFLELGASRVVNHLLELAPILGAGTASGLGLTDGTDSLAGRPVDGLPPSSSPSTPSSRVGASPSDATLGNFSDSCGHRRAAESDIPGLLSCLRAAFELYQSEYASGAFVDTVLTESSARARLRTMRVRVTVDRSGAVRGTVSWMSESNDTGHNRGMAVQPEF